MKRWIKFRIYFSVIFCLLTAFTAAFPQGLENSLITQEHLQAIYNHLLETHWVPQTGLFASFPDSLDAKISQQASIYDQGVMGLLAVCVGDTNRARQILQFLRKAWAQAPHQPDHKGRHGLANFYNAEFGGEGIEKFNHVGPNAWAGLFAARLGNITHDAEATQWALDVAYWIANAVPHKNGAVAMSSSDSPNVPWAHVYSTENNLSYYALLTELLRCPRLHKEERIAITSEWSGVENWLLNSALDRQTGKVIRGVNPRGRDTIQALDTATWFVAAIGPERLAARGIDPYRFMRVAQKSFEVNRDGLFGVDSTDQAEAALSGRPAKGGNRLLWYEGLGQYILAWSLVAEYEERLGQMGLAGQLKAKVRQLTKAFDNAALSHYPGRAAYPYATAGRFFRDGWQAPLGSRKGPASSLIATAWRCFAGLGIDPVSGRQLKNTPSIRLSIPKDSDLTKRPAPAVLYGTSEDMTVRAWKALSRGDWDQAIAQAQATIEEWQSFAHQLQSRKMSEVGHTIDYNGAEEERKNIFKYWALNDVAACYFILGKALDAKKDYPHAAQAFQQIVNHFSLAQVWDPNGWFWAPIDAVRDEYVLADSAHYGQIIPTLVADGFGAGRFPR